MKPFKAYRGYILCVYESRTDIRVQFEGAYVAQAATCTEAMDMIDSWLDTAEEIESESA